MRKQTVFKKLISSILVAIFIMGQFSSFSFVSKAENVTTQEGDSFYLSLSKTNQDKNHPIGYANVNEKILWNMMKSTYEDGRDKVATSNIYCIKAEFGETWNDRETDRTGEGVKYNWSKNLNKDIGTTPSKSVNDFWAEEYPYLNALLWVIDNLYVPGETDKIEFLEQADIHYDEYDGYTYWQDKNIHNYEFIAGTDSYANTLTDDDIIAIQQAALWFFTNYDDINYNFVSGKSWLRYTTDGAEYKTFSQNVGAEQAREAHSYVLFNYLVDEAQEATKDLEKNTYELKNNTAKLWIATEDGTDIKEQPVIEVHKIPDEPEDPKLFDLSLRKAIVSVQDKIGKDKNILNINAESATRNLKEDGSISTIDVASLTEGTTATYNHRKDPIVVETGDTVTYSITIYNEGEESGYANKIVDKLPGTWNAGLRLENNQTTVTSTTGNKYNVDYQTSTNTIILTMAENSPKKVLKPYNEETKILEYETILVKCAVMGKADTTSSKILTNIAYIAEEYNEHLRGIIINTTNKEAQDRDSQTWDFPANNALLTTDIGYTGNGSNAGKDLSESVYFAGEQDDDDFEKIIILPEAFDLSLRKNITKINGTEVKNDRTPVVDKEKLDNITNGTTNTTAEYKHRKDAIAVEDGAIVEYNITIFNEGSIDGTATIIKDQLPTGLKLNLEAFTKENGNYIVKSNKENTYIVTYDEKSNLAIFTLDKTKTVKLLEKHDNGKELDKEIISLQCEVDVKADDNENIFLTNIAYIYEAEQEDGTVVTNQVAGTENGLGADRDSEPYTYSNKTAEELKTIGNIGYVGNKSNENKDLSQNVYFAGEQDEDDFEKLVILPKAFDLSLRKNITKVDGIELNRTPEVKIENLDNGSSTTAEYQHRKDAVIVQDGSKVEYTISIYNEGAVDGIATIIRDQLPTGLKLNLNYFDKSGEKYFVTSSQHNVYEVVYNEQINLLEFKLDKTKTNELKYLEAHTIGNKLAKDTIELECTVNYQADSAKNLYFTNIAYIYEAEQKDGTVVTNQTVGSEADRDSQPRIYPNKNANDLTTLGEIGYTGNKSNADKDLTQSIYFEGEQDDDDFEKLVMLPKTFDLKLIKFISAVNEEVVGNRVISIDTSKLNNTTKTTAEYILEKNPVSVKAGDFVTYTLRVYNEGCYDGYATQISEDIPEGLEFIVITGESIFSWDGKEQKDITEEIKASSMYKKILETNSNWGYNLENSIITTNALSEDLLKAFGQENVEYKDAENKIDYTEVQAIFRVKENLDSNKIIRNEAAISEDKAVDKSGKEINIEDRDSKTDEWKKENSNKNYDKEGKWPIYKEDDEDYDNIITKTFDLSLRKQIIQISDVLYTNRYSKLDSDNKHSNTLYDYYDVFNNKPTVKAGDKVVYSIRVYNEGEIDGYADLIVDSLPSGLEFVEYTKGDGSINDQYGWVKVEGTEKQYQTDYLSYEKDTDKGTAKSTILKAYDGEGEAEFKEIYIECKVKENATKQDSLLNVAQIAEDSDSKGKDIKDKDSTPGNKDNEKTWKLEDDLDIEILELQEFDLALRKFITAVENGKETEKITTRIPQVTYNKNTKQLVYTHPKDAVVVHVGDTVIYTLRVYNEGDIDGYASEIKDDIPEYLEYLPEHTTNKENEWVMYDKDGKVTEDVKDAAYIKTEHLAKGKGVEADKESKETNLIEAFDANAKVSQTNPKYKEIQVAFKVKDPNSTEYEIINFAQISEDSDSEGEPIDDRDSKPDNGKDEPKEDDEDIEKVKVEYFDLSLLKYVTKVLVNENGAEKVIETGNVGDEKDIIPHVQINKKNIDKTVVKFVYSIKITNEGQIEGEATEITDYVPEGLVFMAEDNEHWKDEGNNIISTRQLTGSTLKPGESAEVEVVLRWINSGDNLGPKTNVAEISEDFNEENVPDKDSTPDNKVNEEDDIDDATVLLSVNQGGGIQSVYINLTLIFLSIILVGGILIKKFVL